jgi:hypothetical protein
VPFSHSGNNNLKGQILVQLARCSKCPIPSRRGSSWARQIVRDGQMEMLLPPVPSRDDA